MNDESCGESDGRQFVTHVNKIHTWLTYGHKFIYVFLQSIIDSSPWETTAEEIHWLSSGMITSTMLKKTFKRGPLHGLDKASSI